MAVVVKDRICKQCGKTFPGGPRAWYCPECRSERKKQQAAIRRQRPGPNRPLGSIDHCVVCGKEYVVKGGMQKYCEDCAKSAVAEKDRAAGIAYYRENKDAINPARYEKLRVKEKVCIVCGKTFDPHGLPAEMCSDECRRIRRRLQQYDAERKRQKDKKSANNKFDPDSFVTLRECANIVGVPYPTVYQKITSGEIKGAIKLGSYWIVPKSILAILSRLKIPDGFVPLKEYAKAAGLSIHYSRQKAREGKIPGCIKSNGEYVVPLDEIDRVGKEVGAEGYITVKQMADRDRVSPATIFGWIYSGKLIGSIKIDGKVYVPEDSKKPIRKTSGKKHKKKQSDITPPPAGYITIKQAAERNGVPISTLNKWVRTGKVTDVVKIDNRLYIPDSAVMPDYKSRGPNAEPPDGYINMTEYAKRRGISISAVSHSISRGRITGTIKIGNQRFIPENQEEINKK